MKAEDFVKFTFASNLEISSNGSTVFFILKTINLEKNCYKRLAKKYNKTFEFVRYPRDGHELSRSGEPRHIIDRLNRIINWFSKYTN